MHTPGSPFWQPTPESTTIISARRETAGIIRSADQVSVYQPMWRAVLFEFGPFLRVEQLAGFKSFVCFCTFLLLKKVNEDNVKELYTRINHGYTTGKNTGSGS